MQCALSTCSYTARESRSARRRARERAHHTMGAARYACVALVLLFGAAVLWHVRGAGGPAHSLQPKRRPVRNQPAAAKRDVQAEPVGSDPRPAVISDPPQPTPRDKLHHHTHDRRHFVSGNDGSKPVPRLALRMCSHLLLQISTPGRVAADGLRREDCTFFATDDRDELEALDDHTMQHNHKSRDAAGNSLCGVVHDVLAAHPKTLTVVATAPEEMHAATVKTECEAFFSHQGGTHYSTFKQAFVFNNKVDL